MASASQQQEFVNTWWGSAVAIGKQVAFHPELILATWSLDTGWGDAQGMMNCHALLGIVPFGDKPYPAKLCNDSLCFMCFPTWDDFLSTYAEVLLQSHYNVVREQGNDLNAQAGALANQTGFAGREPTYLGKLLSVVRTNAEYIGTATVQPAPDTTTTTKEKDYLSALLVVGAGLLLWKWATVKSTRR